MVCSNAEPDGISLRAQKLIHSNIERCLKIAVRLGRDQMGMCAKNAVEGADLDLTGFIATEIDELLSGLETPTDGLTDPDVVLPEPPVATFQSHPDCRLERRVVARSRRTVASGTLQHARSTR